MCYATGVGTHHLCLSNKLSPLCLLVSKRPIHCPRIQNFCSPNIRHIKMQIRERIELGTRRTIPRPTKKVTSGSLIAQHEQRITVKKRGSAPTKRKRPIRPQFAFTAFTGPDLSNAYGHMEGRIRCTSEGYTEMLFSACYQNCSDLVRGHDRPSLDDAMDKVRLVRKIFVPIRALLQSSRPYSSNSTVVE